MGDEQLHTEHHVFSQKKLQHATAINSSPRRGSGPPPPPHPYATEEQPPLPHWSQENFESKKRVHATEIRYSPRRSREGGGCDAGGGSGGGGGAAGDEPHQNSRGDVARGVHRSQKAFAIEKLEHMTPVLPMHKEQAQGGSRDPDSYRHTSCDALQKEKMGHKTPLYPDAPPHGGGRNSSNVIDNYLNLKPHEEGFLHSSHETFQREKNGHLTQINPAQRGAPEAAPDAGDGGATLPHSSAEEFMRKKHRHATDIRASPRRRRSDDRTGGGGGGAPPDGRARARSPPGCWHSRSGFQHAKNKHATPINPVGAEGPTPPRSAEPADPAAGGGGRGGYTSFANLSVDKKRHVADVDAARRGERPVAAPGRGGGAHQSADGCGGCGIDDAHQSHVGFTEEKMKHLTEIRQSPRRARGGGGGGGGADAASPHLSPGQFCSLKALQRAKRGHTHTMGAGTMGDAGAPQAGAGGGAAAAPQAGGRTHVSYRQFAEEKRGHVTGILTSPQQPARGTREGGSPAAGGPGDVHRSVREFTAEKRQHLTGIRQSPPRYRPGAEGGGGGGGGGRGSAGGAAQDPGVLTSHQEFSRVKQRHSYEMDSPRRSQRRAAPAVVASPSIPSPPCSSAAATPARTPTRADGEQGGRVSGDRRSRASGEY